MNNLMTKLFVEQSLALPGSDILNITNFTKLWFRVEKKVRKKGVNFVKIFIVTNFHNNYIIY